MSKQINTTYYDEDGEMLYFLTQWDCNRQITIKIDEKITTAPEIHFFNKTSETAIVSNAVVFDSTNNTVMVAVPNILLKDPYAIYMYVYYKNTSGVEKTETFVRIPVRKRPQPDEYNYSDSVEIIYLENMITKYQELIDQLEELDADTLITNASDVVSTYNDMIATPTETVDYLNIAIVEDDDANSFKVENISAYGFVSNGGYYESNNAGKGSTYALCKVTFKTDTGYAYFDCINIGEANYDFGILSAIDSELSESVTEDTSNVKRSFKGSSSSSVQTVVYNISDYDEHYVYVKFRKDSSVNTGRDSLRFIVRFE